MGARPAGEGPGLAWSMEGGGQSFPGRPRAGTRPPPLALRAFWTAEGADIAAPPTRFPEGHMRPREGSDSPSTPGRLTWPLPTLFLCQPSWPLNDEHNGCNHSISASAAVPRASQTWETRVPIAALETPLTDGETEARSHSPTRPSSHSAEAARPALRQAVLPEAVPVAAGFFQNLSCCVCF